MRFNTLLVLVFAAISAPALAAPLGGDVAGGSIVARDAPFSTIQARDLINIAARRDIDEDDSGALGLAFSKPSRPPRDLDELLRRAMDDDDESGAGLFGSLFKIGSKVLKPLFSGGSGDNQEQQQQQRRDADMVYSLLARALADDDESGAGLFGSLLKIGGKVAGHLFDGDDSQQPQRRAPSQPHQDPKKPQHQQHQDPKKPQHQQHQPKNRRMQRRGVDDAVYELLARAAEDDDESGAGLFGSLARIAGKVAGHLFDGDDNQQPQRRAPSQPHQDPKKPQHQQHQDPKKQQQQQHQDPKKQQNPKKQRRGVDDAVYELLARAADDDESGAAFWDFVGQFI